MLNNLKRPVGLGLVLICLAGTLAVGAAVKAPCASGNWNDVRQYRHLCYSDIVPLLGTEQLTAGRLPFLDPCAPSDGQCDEYPVVSMYAMRLAAWASNTLPGFFWANVVLLSICAAIVAVCLYLLVGPRALVFALAPTLLVYGFMNWDLLTVALATLATLAYLNRRDVWSGVLLGLGAAAKIYPALLVVPFVLGRFKERDPDAGIHLAWAAAGTWVAVNVPFAIASPSSWWEFFRFNAQRPADWDSLWFIVHHRLTGDLYFGATKPIDVWSAILFVGISVAVWMLRRRIDPDFPRWTFGFPLLVIFLLTNKVYSPQYGLWLLPWFALALPSLRLFVSFELADLAVFVTRFSWFGRYSNVGGLPIGAFETAVVVRALVLVWCLVAWTLAGRTAEASPSAIPVASTA
ncbi:MAG: glycosyltransferase family 87 protein [Actinomycetota bacterium]